MLQEQATPAANGAGGRRRSVAADERARRRSIAAEERAEQQSVPRSAATEVSQAVTADERARAKVGGGLHLLKSRYMIVNSVEKHYTLTHSYHQLG